VFRCITGRLLLIQPAFLILQGYPLNCKDPLIGSIGSVLKSTFAFAPFGKPTTSMDDIRSEGIPLYGTIMRAPSSVLTLTPVYRSFPDHRLHAPNPYLPGSSESENLFSYPSHGGHSIHPTSCCTSPYPSSSPSGFQTG